MSIIVIRADRMTVLHETFLITYNAGKSFFPNSVRNTTAILWRATGCEFRVPALNVTNKLENTNWNRNQWPCRPPDSADKQVQAIKYTHETRVEATHVWTLSFTYSITHVHINREEVYDIATHALSSGAWVERHYSSWFQTRHILYRQTC
jgi:hypothetical protein